ncbi:MAG TPA: helix-turn-helix domain-containing protein [Acidimicrobiia bacterium]|nr:helix-turn-helix domain-containing protein [Acidimicrobiia bacterium]
MNVKQTRRRRRLTRAESQAETRRRLVEAAVTVFARHGYYAATIEEIVEEAGYSRGAFYANFVDKAELLLAAIESERERDFADLAGILDPIIDKEGEILPALYAWFSKRLSAPLDRAAAEFELAAADNPVHRRRLAENNAAVRQLAASLVEQYCRRHGVELTVDHLTFASMVIAAVDGFASQLRLDPGSVSPDTMSLALRGLWAAVTA